MADLFRCDYCGELTALGKGQIFWTPIDDLGDDELYTPAVYCSPYCGRKASSRSGSGRG